MNQLFFYLFDLFIQMFFKNIFKYKLKQFKRIFVYLFLIFIFYYSLYLLSCVQNERIRLRPKIYLWSHLAKSEDHKCRLPLDIDPWDPSITKYLEVDPFRRVVCPHENTTYDWTQTDENGVNFTLFNQRFAVY